MAKNVNLFSTQLYYFWDELALSFEDRPDPELIYQ